MLFNNHSITGGKFANGALTGAFSRLLNDDIATTKQAEIKQKWKYMVGEFKDSIAFWERGHPRNLAVGCQKLYGRTSIGKSAMATTSAR